MYAAIRHSRLTRRARWTSSDCCSRRNATSARCRAAGHAHGAQLCLRAGRAYRTARCSPVRWRESPRRCEECRMETLRGWSRAVAVSLVVGVVGCGGTEQRGAESPSAVQSQQAPARRGGAALPKLVRNRFGFSRTMTENGSAAARPGESVLPVTGAERPRLQHLSRARGRDEPSRRKWSGSGSPGPTASTLCSGRWTGPPLRWRTCRPSPRAATRSGFSSTGR